MYAILDDIKVENCGGWLLLYIGHSPQSNICGMQTTHKACSVSACAPQATHQHMLAPYKDTPGR